MCTYIEELFKNKQPLPENTELQISGGNSFEKLSKVALDSANKTEHFFADGNPFWISGWGDLISRLRVIRPVEIKEGCGALTHVAGTNDGKMPCGSILHSFGDVKPYYCGKCEPSN